MAEADIRLWTPQGLPDSVPVASLLLDATARPFAADGYALDVQGVSRPYTVFSGAAEIAGGMLLLLPRTTTIGAAISAAVMLNVALLNYCYDVGVKLYSTHLLVMAVVLLLPEAHSGQRALYGGRSS